MGFGRSTDHTAQADRIRFLVIERSIENLWSLDRGAFRGGWHLARFEVNQAERNDRVAEVPVVVGEAFVLNETKLTALGITPRELEILGLIAKGLSNREIAEKLFVSENTVKTHSSRLFDKLSAKRRTQAVLMAKEMGLIP
jgi:ATP/maltotriose-dependent transcriptional regulator MalT